ncbi:MAG: AraC family transcriptional regulator [Myxococcales bacterium]|nr:AraC family transcriptional regulator [Myxococcales bacterium]
MQVTYQRIERVIDFVEANLQRSFTLEEVAAAAGMSLYHVHRMFRAAVGDSLKAYVRKRRLTLAAKRLRGSDDPLVDLALDAGFSSQTAFTRAFREWSGVTPGRYRASPDVQPNPGTRRVTSEAVRLRHRGISHTPRLVQRTVALRVRGWGLAIDFDDEVPVVDLWDRVIPRLTGPGGALPEQLIGVAQATHPQIPTDAEHPVAYLAGPVADGPLEAVVPCGLYAVFDHRGALPRIHETVSYAWGTWLPQSPFRKSTRPDLEVVPRESLGRGPAVMAYWLSVEAAEGETT